MMKSLLLVLLGLVAYTSGCGIIERLKIKRQWTHAFGNGGDREEFGLKLWIDLFSTTPGARGLFARVNGDNEFSDEFMAHSQRVLGGLDTVISLMDDEAVLNSQLAHLKAQHATRNGGGPVTADQYGLFKVSLGRTLAKTLGRYFAKDAWNACFDVISAGMS